MNLKVLSGAIERVACRSEVRVLDRVLRRSELRSGGSGREVEGSTRMLNNKVISPSCDPLASLRNAARILWDSNPRVERSKVGLRERVARVGNSFVASGNGEVQFESLSLGSIV